ncbi:MAG: response regulator [Acidobacteriota bacterium]
MATNIIKVLLIEDNPGDIRLVREMLAEARNALFDLRSTNTLQEGLELMAGGGFDILLLDLSLPDSQGLETLKRAQSQPYAPPIVLLTGLEDESLAINALHVGAQDYLVKGQVNSELLARALSYAIERKNVHSELVRSQKKYENLINSIDGIVLEIEPTTFRITFISKQAERLLGYPSEHWLQASIFWQDHIHLEDREQAINSYKQAVSEKKNYQLEYRLIAADNNIVWVREIVTVVMEDNRVVRLRSLIVDITERKQAEERIHEQAALLDIAPDAIMVCDLEEKIVYWSRGAEHLYGWHSGEVIGCNASELLYKSSLLQLQEAFHNVLEKGEWTGELQQLTKNGREIAVESRQVLVRDSQGQAKAQLIVNTDITEKKKLAAQFLRTQRMESIGTLAGGIAHDLNNALTPIAMATQFLEDRVIDEGDKQCLNIIKTCVTRSSEMVKQVLSFVRGVEGERIAIQLKHMVGELTKVLQQTLPKSIKISTSISRELWLVNGDATQLYQVLMNLCINARDAMTAGGELKIVAENILINEMNSSAHPGVSLGRFVLITVTDTGKGIPAEMIDKIFEPFFTTKDIGKGTGLGLSTALSIVRSHDGFIDVKSEYGKGTEFHIYLPAGVAQPSASSQRQVELPTGNGEMILIVDDEAAIREITKSTLAAYGYNVLTASDGAEALAICAKNIGQIDLVLMDLMMPVLDGVATIKTLEKLDPNLKIIPTSGLLTKADVDMPSVRVKAFLPKPYTTESLLKTVWKALHISDQDMVELKITT